MNNPIDYLEHLRNGARAEAAPLAELLHHLADAYYNGEGLVPDAEYDRLQELLQELAPTHPQLEEVGAPVKGEGVLHRLPMLSLQKCTTFQGFYKWAKDVKEYIVRPKYDGIALSLIYDPEKGTLQRIATRGDGRLGEDVTDAALYSSGIMRRCRYREVRGELVLPLCLVPNLGSDEATHPRNIAAGILARKGAKGDNGLSAANLEFYAYDIPGADLTEQQKMFELAHMGFATGPSLYVKDIAEEAACGPDVWFPDRASWPFPADGVVCRESRGVLKGETEHHPKHSIAWKFPSDMSVTGVVDVEWKPTRNGTVTPVAVLDTIKVDGAMISRATLHSLGRFRKLRLRRGSRVQVARRGGVIPHVEQVTSLGGGKPFVPPTNCPSCDSPLDVVDGGYDEEGNVAQVLWCPYALCPAQMADVIRHWFVSLGADGFGPRACATLAARTGGVEDVYRLDWEDRRLRDALGAANTLKLREQLTLVRAPTARQLLVALGIPGLGAGLARQLAERWAFQDLFDVTVEDLVANVPGVGERTAAQVVKGLARWLDVLASLVADGFLVLPAQAATAPLVQDGPLFGEQLCFTGTLAMPRKQAQDLARAAGAKVVDTLIVGVTCVVMGSDVIDGSSSKARKAYDMQRRLGNLKIWSEDEFLTRAAR